MRKSLLMLGLSLVLASLLVTACGSGESVCGEYQFASWIRLVITEEGTFYYEVKDTTGEWQVMESGEWEIDNQGDNLYLQLDGHNLKTTIGDDKIIVGTNLKIPIGTWEKVE